MSLVRRRRRITTVAIHASPPRRRPELDREPHAIVGPSPHADVNGPVGQDRQFDVARSTLTYDFADLRVAGAHRSLVSSRRLGGQPLQGRVPQDSCSVTVGTNPWQRLDRRHEHRGAHPYSDHSAAGRRATRARSSDQNGPQGCRQPSRSSGRSRSSSCSGRVADQARVAALQCAVT